MLDVEIVLKKAEAIYLSKRPNQAGIRSEQIKALATVMVEEINRELAIIKHTQRNLKVHLEEM